MIKEKVYLFSVLLGSCVIGGCTDNGLLFRSVGEYEQNKPVGSYYIGEPYTVRGVLYTPSENYAYRERGAASWYRRDDAHLLTTNGEVFDANEMTAAHKTLPLPSLVRITNLENGNVAIVRVNDRGPNVNNRLIDVSQKVAAALEFPATGTTMVEVEVLADESRRLKAEALGRTVDEGGTDSASVAVDETVATVPLGSNQAIYQPDVAVMPLYEIPVADGAGVGEKKAEETVLSNEPLDLVGSSFGDVPPKELEKAAVVVSSGASAEESAVSVMNEAITEDAKQVVSAPAASVTAAGSVVTGEYMIQIGAFGNEVNAERAAEAAANFGSVIRLPKGQLTVIRIGPFENQERAREVLDKVRQAGYGDAIIQVQK